ncbi:MAG: M28 family peptidase [Candidatus Lokiarchaeota archaeon]|nr:M28 family peptidase [Candidatus Lokiarchaeota archaeon]
MTDDKLNNYMYEFIEKICNEVGPRESGTEQEILAGNIIEEELTKICDEAHQEEYISSPHAFLGGIRYSSFLVLVSILLYWLSLLIDLRILLIDNLYSLIFMTIAFILIITSVSYFILEVMKYHESFDFLFPKRKSKNIVGVIKPSRNIKNSVIFSAHHDSAFEFNTFYYLKRFGQIIINVGYLGVGIIFIVIILKLILQLLSIDFIILFLSFGFFFLVFIPIILVYMFFHSYHPVLGAFDNLSGVAVVLGIGKFLSQNEDNPEIFPKNTQVYLISFAGEEAGLRGAKRYTNTHFHELKEEGTVVVNMDSIGKKGIVIIHDREPGIGAKHDPKIYQPLFEIAKKINPNAKISPLPFGATDGGAFSKKGIPTASIGGLNLKDELPPYYHTRLDIPENVEKEALGQFLKICLEYLKYLDTQ